MAAAGSESNAVGVEVAIKSGDGSKRGLSSAALRRAGRGISASQLH